MERIQTPLTRSNTEFHIIKQRKSLRSAASRSSLLISSLSVGFLNERSLRIADWELSENEVFCEIYSHKLQLDLGIEDGRFNKPYPLVLQRGHPHLGGR
jgi:hypothetical protein